VADRSMISAATIAAFEAELIDYARSAGARAKACTRECCTMIAVPLIIPRPELAVKEVTVSGHAISFAAMRSGRAGCSGP